MPRQLKAYTLELVFSKLMFPESVIGLILDYGCKVNDYLFVVSTPSHTIFDVWAMWSHCRDPCRGLVVREFMMRFLGSWYYKELLSLLCVSCPGTKLSWVEVVVDMGRGRKRYQRGKLICPLIHPAVFHTQHRLGRWAIDRPSLRWAIGGEGYYPFFEYMALH